MSIAAELQPFRPHFIGIVFNKAALSEIEFLFYGSPGMWHHLSPYCIIILQLTLSVALAIRLKHSFRPRGHFEDEWHGSNPTELRKSCICWEFCAAGDILNSITIWYVHWFLQNSFVCFYLTSNVTPVHASAFIRIHPHSVLFFFP